MRLLIENFAQSNRILNRGDAMEHENELMFLCDTFKKARLSAMVIPYDELTSRAFDAGLEEVLGYKGSLEARNLYLSENPIEPNTLYKATDTFGLSYIWLKLPFRQNDILIVGPYLTSAPTKEQLLELGEQLGVSPKRQRYLEEYCASIPILTVDSHLFVMLDTFCERIWNSPSFAITDVGSWQKPPVSPINESMQSDGFDDLLVNIKAMETRYAFENELIRAVTLGQIHMEKQLLAAFSEHSFEKRLTDQLRNAKNYSIIMNTLLRKAAETGGVHPIYLDRVSSEFAMKIERMSVLAENFELMCEMFRSYCRLVRKHSLKEYSILVQKTVLLIDSDIAADLSLSSLAQSQGVSAGYLSTIFKRETGKTVSSYIREKRIKHAEHLLVTTRLQIQTVALHCGIVDVQYFSKIFKKLTGKTPKEYRETSK